MRPDDQQLQQLALLAYESVGEPQMFARYLDRLRQILNVRAVTILTPMPGEAQLLCLESGLGDEFRREYLDVWQPHDEWALAWLRNGLSLNAGDVRAGHEYLPEQELTRTDFFNAFPRRFDLWNLCTLIVEDGIQAPLTALAIHRHHGCSDFSADEKAVLRAIHRPLQRSLRAYWAMAALRERENAIEAVLAAQAAAAFVLSSQAQLCYANPRAEALLRSGLAACSSMRRLQRVAQIDTVELAVLIRTAATGEPQHRSVWNLQDSRVVTGNLHVAKLSRVSLGSGVWRDAAVLLSLCWDNPESQQEARRQAMAQECGFTPTECLVLSLLGQGHSTHEAAQKLGVSMATLRTHVRHLVAKSGQRRLMDLMREIGPGKVGQG